MDHFQISIQKRIISRILFYAGAILILWLMGRIAPGDRFGSHGAAPQEKVAFVKVYLGVPVELVDFPADN